MASFSEQLKNESEPIWQRIFDRPFLKEIKEGTLPEETFRFYLLQDYLYLGVGRTVVGDTGLSPRRANIGRTTRRRITTIILAKELPRSYQNLNQAFAGYE